MAGLIESYFFDLPKESQSLTQLFGRRLIIDRDIIQSHAPSPYGHVTTHQSGLSGHCKRFTWGPLFFFFEKDGVHYIIHKFYLVTYIFFKGYMIIFKMYINLSVLINSF